MAGDCASRGNPKTKAGTREERTSSHERILVLLVALVFSVPVEKVAGAKVKIQAEANVPFGCMEGL